jgi:hypothetical protein
MTEKFKSLADFLIGWSWDKRTKTNPIWGTCALTGSVIDKVDRAGRAILRRHVVEAERFRLSDGFLLRSLDLASTKEPAEMLSIAGLAKLPFDKPILVEFDANVAYHKRLELRTVYPLETEPRGHDGYLFLPFKDVWENHRGETGWLAVHLSDDPDGMPVWPVTSMCGKLSEPEGVTRGTSFRASAWGYTVGKTGELGYAIHSELLNVGRAFIDPYFSFPMVTIAQNNGMKTALRNLYVASEGWAKENAGSLRLACAILAGLNTVPTRRSIHRPNSTYQYRMKTLANLSITDVAIDAKPGHERAVYEHSFRTAIRHRLHDVRGHWRDFARGDAPYCAHEITETDNVYALCGKCTRLLRWVVPHERGDEALGRVIHDNYTVQ